MDSSVVLAALVAKLGADAALLALMPNGVYEDNAPIGSTRYVIVSHVMATDTAQHGQPGHRRAYETHLFLVEARSRDGGDVKAAAARIDALLEDGTLVLAGGALMAMNREEFTRGSIEDQADSSILWKRRGGRYGVQVAPD